MMKKKLIKAVLKIPGGPFLESGISGLSVNGGADAVF